MKRFKFLVLICILAFSNYQIKAQKISLSVGTDIPYQHYLGATFETGDIDFSYRTGILIPPYSETILSILESMGTSETYISLLENAYDFGWMNSIGTYYSFPERNWYLGFEFRLDYLTAEDSSKDLIETITGRTFRNVNPGNNDQQVELGLLMYGLGVRLGKSFNISDDKKHQIKTEISFSKHLATQSFLSIRNSNADDLNKRLDDLLWENVFKNYGFIGGIGVAYSYAF